MMKYYIKAKRSSTEYQVDLATVTEVRILDKENAEVRVNSTVYNVSGVDTIKHLLACCDILERKAVSDSIDGLKTDISGKLNTISVKLDELAEIKTTISTEAGNTRTNDTTNTATLKQGIDACSTQIEKISANYQNPLEMITVDMPNGPVHVPIGNIADVWVGKTGGCVVTVGGDRFNTDAETIQKIDKYVSKFKNK